MARKGSRSYNDPAYREKVLRLAPEDAYRRAVKDVNHRVVQYVQQAYQSDHTFLTNQASIDRLTAIMAPAVEAGQLQIADLTNAHLSTLFGVKHPPAPDLSTFERPNISRVRELARPFWTAIKAAEKGKDFDAALAAGEARLTKMVETDLQMAKVRQAREVLKAGGIRRYARVTGGNACWLCEIAATQVYYTEDLLPIHPGCNCSVQPIPEGGEAEIRQGFTPEEILKHSDEQVRRMLGLVEDGAPLSDYQDLVAVREHGEIGPMLTWKHQSFTGPGDLPVPPSREVLEHQAFQAVKQTGGVTIDLAGNTPTDGFAYAPLKGTEVVVPQGEFSPKHIDDFINTHAADLARPGNHLGMWTQDGNVYLDVSKVGAPTAETLAKAQGAHQLAVYDLGNGHDINLGTVDNAGKYTAIGSPTGVLDQYRGEVARANEAVGAGRVPGVAARESSTATAGLDAGVLERTPFSYDTPGPGQPPGMSREDWITKVQPGPIPDYDNPYAVTTQLKARHPDLHADLGGMIDPACARSAAQAVDDLMVKYPDAQLRSVVARGPYNFQVASRYAQTDVYSPTGGPVKRLSQTEIQFNQDFYMNKARLEKSYAKTVTDGFHPSIGDHDAAYAISTHEFAHSMDASGSYRASADVKSVLRETFLDLHPEYREMTSLADSVKVREKYDEWLTSELSDYATGSARKNHVRLPGDLNPSEALAESFTHVELDPDKATDAERALHKMLVDKHTLPYKTDMTVPEWQMATTKTPVDKGDRYLRKYQKQTDAYFQAHATPEQLVNAKEAKRVASQQEIARKQAEQAVERGKSDAIPKAELMKAKTERVKGIARNTASPVGDPGGVEETTRAAMDVERIKANRTALWDEVPPKIRAEGKVWYPGESQVLLDIHAAAGSPFAGDPLADIKVEAVGAAFSPQVMWGDAKTDAANYFRVMGKPYQERVDAIVGGRGRMVYTDSIKRADRVRVATTREEIDLALRGTQATSSHHYDNSPKIRNFLGNLTGEHDLLTSDTWDGKVARLHPDERRFLINEEIRQKNYRSKHPVPLEDLTLYQKGDRIPSYLVDRADALADAANDAARAAGRRQPYLPSPGLMVANGYDILERTAAETLPEGFAVDQYQAGLWIWLRGGGATGLVGL